MALIRIGDTGPEFAMEDETASVGFAQNSSARRLADEVVAEDHTGSVITAGWLNPRTEGTIEVIAKSGVTPPKLLQTVTLANVTYAQFDIASTALIVVTEREHRKVNKEFARYTLSIKSWDQITTGGPLAGVPV